MLNAQWTFITFGGVIYPTSLYRTSPGRGARCSFKVVRISQDVINFRGRSFAMIAASSRSMYQLPCLASGRSMVAKALHSISVSVAPPQQPQLVVTWHGRYVPPSPSSRTYTLGTQDSSTVALLTHSFPCYCDTDSSAALRRSQSFPCAYAGGVLWSWASCAVAQPLASRPNWAGPYHRNGLLTSSPIRGWAGDILPRVLCVTWPHDGHVPPLIPAMASKCSCVRGVWV
jgi:hypothetical protein